MTVTQAPDAEDHAPITPQWIACGYLVATAVISVAATLALKPKPLREL